MNSMKGNHKAIITLLTDFGDRDWFVASMKGVIAERAPSCRLIDVTHRVPPGDVKHAAWILKCVYPFFPEGTVHLVVVDPGVGAQREVAVMEGEGQVFLAPDNGVLSYLLHEIKEKTVRRVIRRDLFLNEVSFTFHGRDVFAPVAASLANGLPPSELGDELSNPIVFPLPGMKRVNEKRWAAEVVFADHFGNLITSIYFRRWEESVDLSGVKTLQLTVSKRRFILPLVTSYSLVEKGRPLAIRGSCGNLELAVNGGSAAEKLGLKVGEKFILDIRI